MRDWPMLVGVGVLMVIGYGGAAWTLRDPKGTGAASRAWRRCLAQGPRLRKRWSQLTRNRRAGALWIASLAAIAIALVRGVFALAAAAHTEQGVIIGFLALATTACVGLAAAVNTVRTRLRGRRYS